MAIASSDLVAELIAQSPKGRVLESKFKGLSDIALGEGEAAPAATYCGYPLHPQRDDSVNVRDNVVGGGGFGGGGGGGGGFGGGGYSESAGFGVRVIHGGVWGFASSPLTTEDEIREVTKHGHRRRESERDRQEGRRQAGADAGVHGLLGDAGQAGPVQGAARRQDQLPAAR